MDSGWILGIEGEGGASGLAVGLGVWIFFVGVWFATREHRDRWEVFALSGFILVAAFAGGWGAAALVGEQGFSSLGALVGAGAALLLAPGGDSGDWRWRADLLVGPGLAGLAVARVGCLFEGCDFGRPTPGEWGVRYGRQTRAWETQVLELGLDPMSDQSWPVHPFALYLALWGLFSALVAEILRRRGLPRGRAGCFAAGFFFAGGSIIEYTREPATVLQVVEGISVYPMIYFIFALIAVVLGFSLNTQGIDRE